MPTGVSIIICCYNSAERLPSTLAHLAAQTNPASIPWEVIVVDNASTDATAAVAAASWPSGRSVPLRVVHEAQKGLSHARHRGVLAAQYDLISFVDDDNWVCPTWIQTITEIMAHHPEVGACGGKSAPVAESELPAWFDLFQDSYAIGQQAEQAGNVTESPGFLWGAGLTIRRQAWEGLYSRAFQPLLADRQGDKLTACGDHELCLALRLTDWQLWYDPRLQFGHYIPRNRLQWSYLRQLNRGFGASSVGLDPYYLLLPSTQGGLIQQLKNNWFLRVAIALLKLLRYPRHLLQFSQSFEGDPAMIEVEILLGRLSELLQGRKQYQLNLKTVWNAPWRHSINSPL